MRYATILAAVAVAGVTLSFHSIAQEKKKLAFVVNASSDFWKLAEAGVKKAQAELPVGIPIRLRFHLQSGDLFSYWVE